MNEYVVKVFDHPVGFDFCAEVQASSPEEAYRLGIEEMMQEYSEEFGTPVRDEFLSARVFIGDLITYDNEKPIYPTDV